MKKIILFLIIAILLGILIFNADAMAFNNNDISRKNWNILYGCADAGYTVLLLEKKHTKVSAIGIVLFTVHIKECIDELNQIYHFDKNNYIFDGWPKGGYSITDMAIALGSSTLTSYIWSEYKKYQIYPSLHIQYTDKAISVSITKLL